jgi:hypothetical protein
MRRLTSQRNIGGCLAEHSNNECWITWLYSLVVNRTHLLIMVHRFRQLFAILRCTIWLLSMSQKDHGEVDWFLNVLDLSLMLELSPQLIELKWWIVN